MKERREKKEEKNKDGACTPGGELKVRRGSCIWGRLLTGGKISWDRRESFRGLTKGPATSLWQAGQSETYTMVHTTALHTPA